MCAVVFMGSKKYPGENTFDAFVSKHGGFDNASTDYERVGPCFPLCVPGLLGGGVSLL